MLKKDIPEFGLLHGLKVVHASTVVAGPIAAELMAENGADVIWIESTRALDTNRGKGGMGAESERRNMRNISIDITSEEGKEVFRALLTDADIFIESSKGGTYKKWGLADDVLWSWNPRLVIAHFSGYGQSGDPNFVSRGAYDPVTQAFSCLMHLNGFPDRSAVAAREIPTDYLAGLTGFGMCLAGVMKARETGKGESFDIAQYEIALRYQNQRPMDWLVRGIPSPRVGNHNDVTAAWGAFTCMDGVDVYLMFLGPSVMEKGLQLFGWEFGSEMFPRTQNFAPIATEGGKMLEAAVTEYCATHTAKEVEDELCARGVPCSRIMDYAMAEEHPHYIARESFTEWDAVDGSRLKGANTMPKVTNSPQMIWRGCPTPGMDSDDILIEHGFSETQIAQLREKGVLRQ
ncbi:MAG: CoA transferase [Coriobacteriales bacterium]|jgi:L-carnitine CoA-transferase|nr:CoA transferase [Coriobacteriales bacterium]